VAFYGVYETADGRYLSIACNEPAFFRDLCEALDVPHLKDRQLSGPDGQKELRDVFARKFKERPLPEWLATLDPTRIAFAPVQTLPEVLANRHFQERGMFEHLPRQGADPIMQVASAFHLSATPPSVRLRPPTPGQHSREILTELGYSEAEQELFFSSNVVRQDGQ
jgi:alpha-methylacyl-CoA racemase